MRCPECGSKRVDDCRYDLFYCRACGNTFKLEPLNNSKKSSEGT